MAQDGIRINDELSIAEWELSESFVRASGPGGQHVNKVSSAVQLRWNLERSPISAAIKTRFRRLYRNRITQDGDVIVEASAHRRQSLNRDEARERLGEMVAKAAVPPKRRVRTRPTRGSVRRRLKSKKERGEVKALRGKIDPGES